MATKLQTYVQLANETAANLTKSFETWTSFLTTISNIYRYKFIDQILIHAQNPQSIAVACFDTWTKKMRRYIHRGAKGMALVRVNKGYPRLQYVFDVSDTGKKADSRNLILWQYREEYRDAIIKDLSGRFGIPCNNGLPDLLEDIATKLAKDYWDDYHSEIMYELSDSSLEGMPEFNIGTEFRDIAGVSIAYVLLSRCGLHPEKHFRLEDFQNLCDFNTQNLIKILGTAVSQASGQVLHQIAVTILGAKNNANQSASHHTNQSAQKPTIKEIYALYKPVIREALLHDEAYQNACKNSDKDNAVLEFKSAIKRAALSVKDLKFMRIYYDLSESHNRMQREVFSETYPLLSAIPEQSAPVMETDQEDDSTDVQATETENNIPYVPEVLDADRGNSEPVTVTDCIPVPASQKKQEIILDASEVRELTNPIHAATNFHITDDLLGEGGPKAKFQKNLSAIIILKQIESENRTATPDEQQILSQYVGWGGIPDAFDSEKAGWEKEYQELKAALTPEEYAAARASTLNAHYTSPVIICSIYETLDRMGFSKGNILEPAMGIGNFFGMLPENMRESKLYGVELDGITGRIAKQLYPKADIKITGFENTNYLNDFFDVAVGNVPFGQYKVTDRQYDKHNFLIHDYFFAKTLDKARPGGVVAFVTSKGTMDKKSPEVRKYLAQRAELLGAVRLPNTAFKENAGTEVTSDILFLKKRDRVMDLEPDWIHLTEKDGIALNQYFADHPEMIIGRMEMVSGPYGMESTCQPDTSKPFDEQLSDGDLKETQTANYFSTAWRLDCAVILLTAH